MTRAGAAALGAVVVVVVVGACDGRPKFTDCGRGTVRKGDVCVALTPGDVRCGEGTFQDPATGACVPLVECGPGTVLDADTGACRGASECGPGTFFDPGTGTCLPETTCGLGTVLDAATGACVPEFVCGAGTALDEATGACAPLPPCVDGAVLDEATGLCTSDLVCGAGQIVVGGVCVEPEVVVALEADVVEPSFDRNDPLLGGAPEALPLEPQGARVVALGVLGRPVDVAGNGTLVQDRDVWRFTGAPGLRLRVDVVSTGAPDPTFRIEGPRGYVREAARAGEVARDVILPYAGDYDVIVVPRAYATSGIPQGGPDAGYALVVEEIPLPVPRLVSPGASAASPATFTGALFDGDDNGFRVNADARTAVQVRFASLSGEVVPAVVALRGAELLADVPYLDEDGVASFFLKVEDGARFYLDWNEAAGAGDAYEIDVHFVPLVERGDVPADFVGVTGTRDVAGKESVAFQFAIATPQVVLIDLFGTGLASPDVQVVGPGGTRARVDDDDELFFFGDPGEYVVFCRNDGTSDDVGVGATLTFLTPYDLGSLDETNVDGASVTGADLLQGFSGWEEAWAVVRTSIPALLTLDVDVAAGDPALSVYDYDGTLLRALGKPHLDRPLHVVNRDPRPILLRLQAEGRASVGWRLSAVVRALPTRIEAEPDDTRFSAVDLGALPLVVRGGLRPNDVDVYRFSLPGPIDPGDSIRVVFDNLVSDSTTSTISDAAFVRVLDDAYAPLPSIPDPASSPGTLGVNTATHVAGYEGGGPFYVEVFGDFLSSDADYLLSIEADETPVEVEPNDALVDADPLAALPARVVGWRSGADPQDAFRIDLAADLAAGTSLALQAINLENSNALALSLLDAAGAVIATTSRVEAALDVPLLAAGTYYATVTGGTGGEPIYALSAAIGGRAEQEPNDSATLVDDLGALGATDLFVHGRATNLDVDVLSFSPGAAGYLVEVVNLDDGSPLHVEVHAGAALDGTSRLARDRSAAVETVARARTPGTTFVRIVGDGATADRWRLRIAALPLVEDEPNDVVATSVAAPATARGAIGGGDVDQYAFVVGAGADVDVVVENRSDGTSLDVALQGPAPATTTIASGVGFRVPLSAANVAAGTYTVRVTSTDAAVDAVDLYDATVAVTP